MGTIAADGDVFPWNDVDLAWDVVSRRMFADRHARRKRETDTAAHIRAGARARFFDALYGLAPHVSAEALAPAARALFEANEARGSAPLPVADVAASWEETKQHVAAWQRRYDLLDDWCFDAAVMTGTIMLTIGRTDIPLMWTVDDILASPHAGKLRDVPSGPAAAGGPSFRLVHPLRLLDIPVTVHDLLGPDTDAVDAWGNHVGTIEDPGDIGTFNPRGETIEDAVKRLRPALESRLRAALAGIVHQDRVAFDGVAPVSFRTPTAFEWLVRYQVLGESKAAIARDVDRDRPHVTREVNRLARLIDLTLRAERGGRPRKRAAHTIRVTGREARTRRA